MTERRRWTTRMGDTDFFLDVKPWHVNFASGGPSHWSQSGATITHEEFRSGRFQSDVERHFGRSVLDEVLSLLVDVSIDRFFGAEGEMRDQLVAWDQAPIDDSLAEVLKHREESGRDRFNLPETLPATTNGFTLSMERHTATITRPDASTFTIPQSLRYCALLAHDGHFYLVANGHGHVFDTEGILVTSTEHLEESHGISHAVRLSDVVRQGDDVAFVYSTFGYSTDPAVRFLGRGGSFRLASDGRITARGSQTT